MNKVLVHLPCTGGAAWWCFSTCFEGEGWEGQEDV